MRPSACGSSRRATSGEDNQGPEVPDRRESRASSGAPSEPIVDIWGMMAQLGLAQGPVTVAANQGRYNLDQQKVDRRRTGPRGRPDGEQLDTRDVTVDLKQRTW